MNALLTKWVVRFVSQGEDLMSMVIRDRYGGWIGWEGQARSFYGASTFWLGILKTITILGSFFSARLGNWSEFCFWLDAWSEFCFWIICDSLFGCWKSWMSWNIDIRQLLFSSIQRFSSFSVFRPCFYFSNSLYTFFALVIDSLLFPIPFSSNSLLTFLAFIVNSSLHLIPISENSLFTSSTCIIYSPLILISALCFLPPQLSTLFDDFILSLLLLFSPWAFNVNSTFTLHKLVSCRSFKLILQK